MDEKLARARQEANFTRYQKGQQKGHYESFFQRANHPSRPLAFWIRYTIFNPHGRPQDAIGELWAIYFNGETNQHIAVKREVPMADCTFENHRFGARIADAELSPGKLRGSAEAKGSRIDWDLSYSGGQEPVFDLPLAMYSTPLPKAKALVGVPMTTYKGTLQVDGETIEIDNWLGSQNHNWGSKHTDHYAWGQVAGFDNAPESFLELATARLKIGPFWTPFFTPLILRHKGREYECKNLIKSAGKASFDYFSWNFRGEHADAVIEGRILGKREDFVGLNYYNPPGTNKYCLNSKIAACEVTFTPKDGGAPEKLETQNRAAFEILTDENDHGITVRV